ncbi:MAG: cation transporter [Zestosphaera sp.]
MRSNGVLGLILMFSTLGGLFKILGGLLYGSRAVFVDALTSIANLIALLLSIRFWRSSLEPPDEDHHFGHYKLAFGGTISTLMVYSFVAGIATFKLLDVGRYSVSLGAPLMALLGVLCYTISVLVSKRFGSIFVHYSAFTVSELIEGAVVILSSLGGAILSYLIDYGGAVVLTIYILHELKGVFNEVLGYISDIAPSAELMDLVRKEFVTNGLHLSELRLRSVDGKHYQGTASVVVESEDDISLVSSRVDNVKKLLGRRGIELVVEIKPEALGRESGE